MITPEDAAGEPAGAGESERVNKSPSAATSDASALARPVEDVVPALAPERPGEGHGRRAVLRGRKIALKARLAKRWRRPTVKALRDEQRSGNAVEAWDKRANEETHLPDDERVELGGLAIAELFTPSTVSGLYDRLRSFDDGSFGSHAGDALSALERSRGGEAGGWTSLGIIRRPGDSILMGGYRDAGLPDGVSAVWLKLHFLIPSVAVVVATFTFRDDIGDLSPLLRADYGTTSQNVRLRVGGPLGRIRSRIPWARPAHFEFSSSVRRAEDNKRVACEERMMTFETSCSDWFFRTFPGRLARAAAEFRCSAHIVFTNESVPYSARTRWLGPAGLDAGPDTYRCTDVVGWAMKTSTWPIKSRRFPLTFAARRKDAARPPTQGEKGEETWYLTQEFAESHSALVARYAVLALLGLYADRLAKLRDQAAVRHRVRRTVRDAWLLDQYLVGDGLDAATITSDLVLRDNDLELFRYGVPEYEENFDGLPENFRTRPPAAFVPELHGAIQRRAKQLARDTEVTTGNIRSSADLRQSVANTRLQRTVVAMSLAALVTGVAGLLVALGVPPFG